MIKGENVDFERGRELGLVHEVLPAADFMATVLKRAEQFCPPHKASRAVGLIKRSVTSGAEMAFGEHLALERELQQRLFTGADAAEGFAAFNEKRPPRFTGR
jgi:enoyl-CoA hydratase/carnithine racemase